MSVVLVTGGAGYIGSHVCKALRQAGFTPVTFDNLSHGHEWAIRWGPFFYGDLQNSEDLDKAFLEYRPQAVIHLAGSIDLRESIENPYKHYFNNVIGSLSLLKAMVKHQVTSLVFSSSAAVYTTPEYLPIDEDHPKNPVNPYGKTKLIIEEAFKDFHRAHGLNAVSLRYFNAAGADPDAEIGEAHNPETHLITRLILIAQKKEDFFTVYNTSLPTQDGTAIRDYIHVSDLASAHVSALHWLQKKRKPGTFNLGTGQGHSVLQVIDTVKKVTGCPIEVRYENRNLAELPALVADPQRAKQELQWNPMYSDLTQIIETAWKWHSSPILAPV
ncbi:MAG: UDP-glucose 4-epimerase [Chlamydiae bacterium]|nr:UDP-glucose 4-epimerase [Chlamydiota bacterium]